MQGTDIKRRAIMFGIGMGAVGLGGMSLFGTPALAQASKDPTQRMLVPNSGRFDPQGLIEVEKTLYEKPTTTLLVYDGGRLAYQYGNGNTVSYLASARKSILSMLYGNYVADGTIDLDATLADLDIQDNETLSEGERQAKVRDLLTSSSGVYHPAGSPGGNDNNPERGSKAPGEFFQYNNWDFNVLGAIFEKRTGLTVFEALERDLAKPLGFEDYDGARQKMLGYGDRSRYLAYHMFLSGRDMGKLAQLMLQRGEWNGTQVIPAEWVDESTKQRFTAAQTGGPSGYGYLWWTPEGRGAAWEGSYLANGNIGQFILCLPAIETVIVHRRAVTDQYAIARNYGETPYVPDGVTASQFLEIADAVIATRA